MNKSYNIVWNPARKMFMVASELTRGSFRIGQQVRTAGLASGLMLSVISAVSAEELGPQQGASITLQDGDILTSTVSNYGIDSSTPGGSGVIIDGSAVITVSGDTSGTAGLILSNDAHNDLGTATHITVTSLSGETTGIAIDPAGSDSTSWVDANQLGLNVTSAGNAYGVSMYNGNFTAKDSNINVTSSTTTMNYDYVYGAYMRGGSTFSMEGGSLSVSNTNAGARGVYLNDNSHFTLLGGSILTDVLVTGGYANGYANGVFMSGSSSFSMEGGSITATGLGARTVRMTKDNSFTMNGGVISAVLTAAHGDFLGEGNASRPGASLPSASGADFYTSTYGIYGVDMMGTSHFRTENSAISAYNTKTAAYGVYMGGYSDFDMTGGFISSTAETASESADAAGVYMDGSSRFTLTDGIIFVAAAVAGTPTQTFARAYGVYMDDSSHFTMNAGAITAFSTGTGSGAAAYSAARAYGVYMIGGDFSMEGGSIAATAISPQSYAVGSGVYMRDGSNFSMTGGAVSATAEADSAAVGAIALAYGADITGSSFSMQESSLSAMTTATDNVYAYANSSAYGVSLALSDFSMKQGSVEAIATGVNADAVAYGVYMTSGHASIDGGAITAKATAAGGGDATAYGAYINGGSFNMEGGTLSATVNAPSTDNITIAPHAYGAWVGSGSFNVKDGLIQATSADRDATGISARHSDADITLGGKTRIEVNATHTNGFGIDMDGGTFTANEVDISVHAATGIGIDLNHASADLGSGSSITVESDNLNRDRSGGGIDASGNSTFTATALNITLFAEPKDYGPNVYGGSGYGVQVYGNNNHIDLGSDSSIILSALPGKSTGLRITEGEDNVFTADRLTIDISGSASGSGITNGIEIDAGSVDLGTGSRISIDGPGDAIVANGGTFNAEALTITLTEGSGIDQSNMGRVNVGAGSVIDGRNATGRTNGINSAGSLINFKGSEENRNTLYAVNGFGAKAGASATINIANTDIIMSGEHRTYGLWALNGGVINGDNLAIDMTAAGEQGYGIVARLGSTVTLTGETTITTNGGTAIWLPDSDYSVDGNVAITGKIDITGDIINDGSGTINVVMDEGSYFEGNTAINEAKKEESVVNLSVGRQSVWVSSEASTLNTLENAGTIVLSSDSEDNLTGMLNADILKLEETSALDIQVDLGSDDPAISAGQIVLGGMLNISGASGLSSHDAQSVVFDAEETISGNFDVLTVAGAPAAEVDYITIDGRVSKRDATQYVLTAGLSWYADSNVATTPAHGVFTLSNTNGSFRLGVPLEDVAPNLTSGWDGKSLTKKGPGTLVMTAGNTYSGFTDIEAGALWLFGSGVIGVSGSQQEVHIAQGALFGGDNGTVNGNINSQGELRFNNSLTVNGDVINSGSMMSGNLATSAARLKSTGAPNNTLLINGNYTSNGGSLTLNTQLGDDSSPTDKLIVTGDTAGDTTLYVKNAGGAGAATDMGIEVVDVGGKSEGTFTQGNRVQVGAYEYRLYQDHGDWYLRSAAHESGGDDDTGGNEGGDNTSGGETGGGNNNGSGGGNNSGGNTPVTRQYSPDTGAYLGNQWMARRLQMQTLFDREGSQYHNEDGSVWARFAAGKTESQAAGGNVDIDNNYSQFQLGGDIAAWNNGEQSLSIGLMGSYVNADTDSTGNRGADGSQFSANGNVDGYNLGIYATWFADAQTHRGAYIDSWYQYGLYNNSVDNGELGSTQYDSTASAVSLESGYRFDIALDKNSSVSLTPQAQIIWQHYEAGSVENRSGTRINGQNGDSWNSRLGLRVDGKLQKGANLVQPFAEANWLHTSDETSVAFDNAKVAMEIPANRAELKAGIQVNIAEQWSVTAQAAGQKGRDSYSDLNGSLNVRYSW